jgi:hypothetical protein
MLDNLMESISKIAPRSEGKMLPINSVKRNSSNVKSLEMRLSGTREALKSVEKELKEKNKLIE